MSVYVLSLLIKMQYTHTHNIIPAQYHYWILPLRLRNTILLLSHVLKEFHIIPSEALWRFAKQVPTSSGC